MDPVRGVIVRALLAALRDGPRRALLVALVLALLGPGAAAATPPLSTFEPEQELELLEAVEVAGWRVETWGPAEGAWFREAVLRLVGTDGGVAFETRDAWLSVVEQQVEPGWRGDLVAMAAGDDLNGDGGPNLLLEGFSGGAHCCFTYTMLALDEAGVMVLMELFTSHAGASVVDLAGDGRRQLVTADMRYAYEFCSFAESPAPTVVFALEPEAVVVANLDFAEVYQREVVWALERVLLMEEDAWPESHACALAQLVLSLLYGGREAAAEAALVQLDRSGDPASFREALWAIAEASPWFQRP